MRGRLFLSAPAGGTGRPSMLAPLPTALYITSAKDLAGDEFLLAMILPYHNTCNPNHALRMTGRYICPALHTVCHSSAHVSVCKILLMSNNNSLVDSVLN